MHSGGMDLLRHLEYFLAVVDEGSFVRAAEALGMAQPPLSQRIKALEAHLGCELFDRSRRQICLTPQGNLLVPEARTLVQTAHDLPSILTSRDQGSRPVLLDLPDTFPAALLGAVAAAVAAATQQRVLPRALPAGRRGTADDQHPVLSPGPGAHALRLPLGLTLHPQHPLAAGDLTPHPSDFCDAVVLVLGEDDWQRDDLASALVGLGLDRRSVHTGTDTTTAVPQLQMEDAALLTDPAHAASHDLAWYPLDGTWRTWHATGQHAEAVAAAVAECLGGVPMFPVKRRGAGVMALALGWGPGRAPGS